MFVACRLWTVARTSRGAAVLLQDPESETALPLSVTPLEARIILGGRSEEGRNDSLCDFIAALADRTGLVIKRVELRLTSQEEPEAVVRSGRPGEDDHSLPLSPPEAISLAARLSLPIHVEEEYFRSRARAINLIELEAEEKRKNLEEKLFKLVEREEYEEAAQIRDKIKALEPKKG